MLTVPNLSVTSSSATTLTSRQRRNDPGRRHQCGRSTAAPFSFTNGTNALAVGTVGGTTGITTTNGDIHLIADDMALTQTVTASNGNGIVTLEPFTATEAIDLGTNSANHLGLTNAALQQVSAGALRIGSSSFTGDVTVSAPISLPAISAFLSLITTGSGTISQGSGATINVNNGSGGLDFQANTAVAFGASNAVGDVAADITRSGQGFAFTDSHSSGFTVGDVDGVNGIAATGLSVSASP